MFFDIRCRYVQFIHFYIWKKSVLFLSFFQGVFFRKNCLYVWSVFTSGLWWRAYCTWCRYVDLLSHTRVFVIKEKKSWWWELQQAGRFLCGRIATCALVKEEAVQCSTSIIKIKWVYLLARANIWNTYLLRSWDNNSTIRSTPCLSKILPPEKTRNLEFYISTPNANNEYIWDGNDRGSWIRCRSYY